jgi:hypothetical protein
MPRADVSQDSKIIMHHSVIPWNAICVGGRLSIRVSSNYTNIAERVTKFV